MADCPPRRAGVLSADGGAYPATTAGAHRPPVLGLWTRGEETTVTMHGRGDNPTPEEPDSKSHVSDAVWLKFLSDTECAIRSSAPREPSARERAPGWPDAAATGTSDRWTRHHDPATSQADAVGDLWQPAEVPRLPWRDLDDQGRLRRVGSVIAAVAATALTLAAWSQLATSGGTPHDGPGDITLQQPEDAPGEVPAAPSFPAGNPSPGPSS